MSRRIAWILCGTAVVSALVGIVLAIVGELNDHEFPSGRGSNLSVAVISAIVAMLVAVVGLMIARKERDNPIGWIFSAPRRRSQS